MGTNLRVEFDKPKYDVNSITHILNSYQEIGGYFDEIYLNGERIELNKLDYKIKTDKNKIKRVTADIGPTTFSFRFLDEESNNLQNKISLFGHKLYYYMMTSDLEENITKEKGIEHFSNLIIQSLRLQAVGDHHISLICLDSDTSPIDKFVGNIFALGSKDDCYVKFFQDLFKRRLNIDISENEVIELVNKYKIREKSIDNYKIIQFCESPLVDFTFPDLIIEIKKKYLIPLDSNENEYVVKGSWWD